MKPNVDLLRRTLRHIEELERSSETGKGKWDQDVWRQPISDEEPMTICNTAMCFAGWAVALSGCRWVKCPHHTSHDAYINDEDRDGCSCDYKDYVIARKSELTGKYIANILVSPTERMDLIPIVSRARLDLRLTSEQADNLFAGGNTLEDLQTIVADIEFEANNG